MDQAETNAILNKSLRFSSDLVFLALTVWREARGEIEECQLAVACSILNRVARPYWWGNDISSVVFKRLQYSSLTYRNDPQLTTWPDKSDNPVWVQCLQVASKALCGAAENPASGADSYYDDSISAPKWATPDTFVRKIGRIAFYNTDHDHEVST